MKKVMFALCFMFGGVVAVTAQDTQDTTSNQYRTETQTDPSQSQDTTQQDPSQDQAQYAPGQDQDRERIQSTELPDEVKRSLEDQEYRGWLISGAYKATGSSDQSEMQSDSTSISDNQSPANQENANATGAQAEEVYIVELKNGAQTKTVRFDKDGQKIEGMDDQSESSQNQNNQYNQNDQADPNSNQSADEQTPDGQADQSTQSSQSTDSQNDQSTQSTETQTEQSSETQTDQSKANDPK